ncbi:MAG: glycosyltransferase family protein [Candidatus Aquicultorales bacterium]
MAADATNYDNELIIYLDPGFLDKTGHYRNFAKNMRQEAGRRHVDIWHLVNLDVSDECADQYNLERIFEYKAILNELAFRGKGVLLNVARITKDWIYNRKVLWSFSKRLREILDRALNSDYDKISLYMYTCHPLYFPIIAKLLSHPKYRNLPITAHLDLFYLHLGFCRSERAPHYCRMLRNTSSKLERLDPEERVRLYADSERTIARYSPFFRRVIGLMPMPLRGNTIEDIETQDKESNPELTVGFFGYTLPKQGYELIEPLYDFFVKIRGNQDVQFVIRHNSAFVTSKTQAIMDRLAGQTKQIVNLIGQFSHEEYEKHVGSCDIVLILHSSSEYPCQTSGLFVDTLAKRKVVVVPANTWMADMLATYGSGEVFESGNILSLIGAVMKIIEDYNTYCSNVDRNIKQFITFHSAKTLFDTFGVGLTSDSKLSDCSARS